MKRGEHLEAIQLSSPNFLGYKPLEIIEEINELRIICKLVIPYFSSII